MINIHVKCTVLYRHWKLYCLICKHDFIFFVMWWALFILCMHAAITPIICWHLNLECCSAHMLSFSLLITKTSFTYDSPPSPFPSFQFFSAAFCNRFSILQRPICREITVKYPEVGTGHSLQISSENREFADFNISAPSANEALCGFADLVHIVICRLKTSSCPQMHIFSSYTLKCSKIQIFTP